MAASESTRPSTVHLASPTLSRERSGGAVCGVCGVCGACGVCGVCGEGEGEGEGEGGEG